ncbi:uncharacterized protein MONOS_5470p1 [Monocercomonoides exilis]|uniref:uncharacterized protein n=1 Tax=Monocercomonoides exilis TaxID=2049356 RepID=UPI0035596D56|nr:hypothetical protein MONOS_5470p1 [Monocercomonoides exilis]
MIAFAFFIDGFQNIHEERAVREKVVDENMYYRYHLTLYHKDQRTAFGDTYESPLHDIQVTDVNTYDCDCKDIVYFVCDPEQPLSIIVELVLVAVDQKNIITHEVSLGWSLVHIDDSVGTTDISSYQKGNLFKQMQSLEMFFGTPRILPFVVDVSFLQSSSPDASVRFCLLRHKKLDGYKNFLSPNTFYDERNSTPIVPGLISPHVQFIIQQAFHKPLHLLSSSLSGSSSASSSTSRNFISPFTSATSSPASSVTQQSKKSSRSLSASRSRSPRDKDAKAKSSSAKRSLKAAATAVAAGIRMSSKTKHKGEKSDSEKSVGKENESILRSIEALMKEGWAEEVAEERMNLLSSFSSKKMKKAKATQKKSVKGKVKAKRKRNTKAKDEKREIDMNEESDNDDVDESGEESDWNDSNEDSDRSNASEEEEEEEPAFLVHPFGRTMWLDATLWSLYDFLPTHQRIAFQESFAGTTKLRLSEEEKETLVTKEVGLEMRWLTLLEMIGSNNKRNGEREANANKMLPAGYGVSRTHIALSPWSFGNCFFCPLRQESLSLKLTSVNILLRSGFDNHLVSELNAIRCWEQKHNIDSESVIIESRTLVAIPHNGHNVLSSSVSAELLLGPSKQVSDSKGRKQFFSSYSLKKNASLIIRNAIPHPAFRIVFMVIFGVSIPISAAEVTPEEQKQKEARDKTRMIELPKVPIPPRTHRNICVGWREYHPFVWNKDPQQELARIKRASEDSEEEEEDEESDFKMARNRREKRGFQQKRKRERGTFEDEEEYDDEEDEEDEGEEDEGEEDVSERKSDLSNQSKSLQLSPSPSQSQMSAVISSASPINISSDNDFAISTRLQSSISGKQTWRDDILEGEGIDEIECAIDQTHSLSSLSSRSSKSKSPNSTKFSSNYSASTTSSSSASRSPCTHVVHRMRLETLKLWMQKIQMKMPHLLLPQSVAKKFHLSQQKAPTVRLELRREPVISLLIKGVEGMMVADQTRGASTISNAEWKKERKSDTFNSKSKMFSESVFQHSPYSLSFTPTWCSTISSITSLPASLDASDSIFPFNVLHPIPFTCVACPVPREWPLPTLPDAVPRLSFRMQLNKEDDYLKLPVYVIPPWKKAN